VKQSRSEQGSDEESERSKMVSKFLSKYCVSSLLRIGVDSVVARHFSNNVVLRL
jgi:hypothetical protein